MFDGVLPAGNAGAVAPAATYKAAGAVGAPGAKEPDFSLSVCQAGEANSSEPKGSKAANLATLDFTLSPEDLHLPHSAELEALLKNSVLFPSLRSVSAGTATGNASGDSGDKIASGTSRSFTIHPRMQIDARYYDSPAGTVPGKIKIKIKIESGPPLEPFNQVAIDMAQSENSVSEGPGREFAPGRSYFLPK